MSLLRIAAACGLLLAFILIPYLALGAAVEEEAARLVGAGRLASAERGSIALAGMLLLAADIVLPIPSSIVATAMGAALGGPAGTLVNAAGLTAGCAAGLAAGRSGSPLARRILGEALFQRFTAWTTRNGIAAVMLCRAVPVLAEASVLALGAGKARVLPVLGAAAFADVMLGALYAFAGAAGGPAAAPALPAAAAAIGVPALAAAAAWLWMRRGRG
jgi:uncharacterized membrane protein YdjX (TVP38/TMEM64 family)